MHRGKNMNMTKAEAAKCVCMRSPREKPMDMTPEQFTVLTVAVAGMTVRRGPNTKHIMRFDAAHRDDRMCKPLH